MNNAPIFYLAPMRGITDGVFRRAYERRFGQFDRVVAPFIPTVLGTRVRNHHIRDLLTDGEDRDRLVPQVIGRDGAGFLLLSRKLADIGFAAVNWNLGCPAPLVAKKTRGCGLLPRADLIKQFLDDVTPKLPIPLSVKARLGYNAPGDLEKLIPIFNEYPVKELIIHPRTGAQLYDGNVNLERFDACLKLAKLPVVYNGDIASADTFLRLAKKFPSVNRWMIGRGAVGNPFLLRELKAARTEAAGISNTPTSPPSDVKTSLTEDDAAQITGFLSDIIDACEGVARADKTLGRMKEIWKYLGNGIYGWKDAARDVMKCASLEEYREIVGKL